MESFEKWLRTVCFQKPTDEAYDLAKAAWIEATKTTAKRCEDLGKTLEVDIAVVLPTFKRLESVWIGKDNLLLDAMFDFYSPKASRVIDVCCSARRMWKGTKWGAKVEYYDRDQAMKPDRVVEWHAMPDVNASVDVLVYDLPHLPDAAASPKSLVQYGRDYGLGKGMKTDSVGELHLKFLAEAQRVLKPNGLIFAKIKDYVHNHRYQWNLELFNAAVREAGMTSCDLIIKRDPCGGNLKSGRWQKTHHAKNTHCYWVVVRNSHRCEPKTASS